MTARAITATAKPFTSTHPEGNGIEIYRDKELSAWDVRPDGKIEGVTEAMDADGVIGAMVKIYDGIPSGSIMGHVHLTVHDLVETQQFYENVLGISLKSDFFGQAKFFASGNYHHHIGSNMWAGKHLPAAEENQPGLAYFTWVVADGTAYEALKDRLVHGKVSFEETDNTLIFKDNSGIEITPSFIKGSTDTNLLKRIRRKFLPVTFSI